MTSGYDKNLRQKMLNYADVVEWDRVRRKEQGFWAGLRFFKRVQGGRLILASRHWPHRLCWSWMLDLTPIRTDLGYPRKFALYVGHQIRLAVWSHELAFYWQRSWWMPSVGPEKQRAPIVVWRRQFTHPDLPDASFASGQ